MFARQEHDTTAQAHEHCYSVCVKSHLATTAPLPRVSPTRSNTRTPPRIADTYSVLALEINVAAKAKTDLKADPDKKGVR